MREHNNWFRVYPPEAPKKYATFIFVCALGGKIERLPRNGLRVEVLSTVEDQANRSLVRIRWHEHREGYTTVCTEWTDARNLR